MRFPAPEPGQVIRYSYLWLAEHRKGREEGVKDRPCAIVLVTGDTEDGQSVVVLPVTHTPPRRAHDAIELPTETKRRLGLDGERSWVVLTEANRFIWPGPDLRPAKSGDPASVLYGMLPHSLFEQIRLSFIEAIKDKRTKPFKRTD